MAKQAKQISFWQPVKINPIKIVNTPSPSSNNFWNSSKTKNIQAPVPAPRSNNFFAPSPPKINNYSTPFHPVRVNGPTYNAPKFIPVALKNKVVSPVNVNLYPARTKQEIKIIDKNPWGDTDKDRVPNYFDCKPLNKSKQDKTIIFPGGTFLRFLSDEDIPVTLKKQLDETKIESPEQFAQIEGEIGNVARGKFRTEKRSTNPVFFKSIDKALDKGYETIRMHPVVSDMSHKLILKGRLPREVLNKINEQPGVHAAVSPDSISTIINVSQAGQSQKEVGEHLERVIDLIPRKKAGEGGYMPSNVTLKGFPVVEGVVDLTKKLPKKDTEELVLDLTGPFNTDMTFKPTTEGVMPEELGGVVSTVPPATVTSQLEEEEGAYLKLHPEAGIKIKKRRGRVKGAKPLFTINPRQKVLEPIIQTQLPSEPQSSTPAPIIIPTIPTIKIRRGRPRKGVVVRIKEKVEKKPRYELQKILEQEREINLREQMKRPKGDRSKKIAETLKKKRGLMSKIEKYFDETREKIMKRLGKPNVFRKLDSGTKKEVKSFKKEKEEFIKTLDKDELKKLMEDRKNRKGLWDKKGMVLPPKEGKEEEQEKLIKEAQENSRLEINKLIRERDLAKLKDVKETPRKIQSIIPDDFQKVETASELFLLQREERLKKRREREKKYFSILENRERKRKQDKKYYTKPEVIEKRKEYHKEYYQIPEVKEKTKKRQQEFLAVEKIEEMVPGLEFGEEYKKEKEERYKESKFEKEPVETYEKPEKEIKEESTVEDTTPYEGSAQQLIDEA